MSNRPSIRDMRIYGIAVSIASIHEVGIPPTRHFGSTCLVWAVDGTFDIGIRTLNRGSLSAAAQWRRLTLVGLLCAERYLGRGRLRFGVRDVA